MFDTSEYLKLLVALMAIVDIPGNVPMFLQQTARFSIGGRLIAALTAGLVSGLILLVFAFYGDVVLASFGITIAAFKILGGIVILLIALEMLGLIGRGGGEQGGTLDAHNPVAVGIFPLAVPLFAGPGAISAVMVYAHDDFHSDHDLIVAALVVSTAAAIVVGLSLASFVGRFMGPTTQQVLNRLLGMIVGALGVEFILEGIASFYPGIATG